MDNIVIISPEYNVTNKPGGVSISYKVLEKYFSSSVKFYHYKPISYQNHLLKGIIRFVEVFSYINKSLRNNENVKLVILNPSLAWGSLIRDGLSLIFITKSGKESIVFFRGWHDYMVKLIDDYRIIKYFFKKVYSMPEALIVLSYDFKHKLREWGLELPIHVETTVVDDDLLKLDLNISNRKKGMFNILFLARVEKRKGIFEAIESFRLLKQKYFNIQLTVAGEGSHLQPAKNFVMKDGLEDVSFTGYVSGKEKRSLFENSDVYLFPTYGEGMPNSVLEAMAFGLPVITRPVGGLKDFFEDGKMGFLTESKDPEMLSVLIEKLILDNKLYKKISVYNSTFARKHFLASYVAKRQEKIYQTVIKGIKKEHDWKDTAKTKKTHTDINLNLS